MSQTIGEKLRTLRKEYGLTQFELEAQIEASVGSLSRIENGEINPTKETIIKIINVLNLNTFEAASLFNIDVDQDFTKIIRLIKNISKELDIEKALQNVVDEVVYELKLLSGAIFIKQNDKVYSKYQANNVVSGMVNKFLPIPFNKMSVSLTEHKDNIIVKTINENKIFYVYKVEEVTLHVLPSALGKFLNRLVNFKIGITLPLVVNKNQIIGVLFLGKSNEQNFEKEMPLLKAISESIATSIFNAQKYDKLQKELDELKSLNKAF